MFDIGPSDIGVADDAHCDEGFQGEGVHGEDGVRGDDAFGETPSGADLQGDEACCGDAYGRGRDIQGGGVRGDDVRGSDKDVRGGRGVRRGGDALESDGFRGGEALEGQGVGGGDACGADGVLAGDDAFGGDAFGDDAFGGGEVLGGGADGGGGRWFVVESEVPLLEAPPVLWAVADGPGAESGGRELSVGDRLLAKGWGINRSKRELLHLAKEFELSMEWVEVGVASAAHWIAPKLQVAVSTAREWVRLGDALLVMPVLDAAFEANEISYSQLRIIAKYATPDNVEELIEIARNTTTDRLNHALAVFLGKDESPDERDRRHQQWRSFSYRTNAWGMIIGSFCLPPAIGLRLIAAIEAWIRRADSLLGPFRHRPEPSSASGPPRPSPGPDSSPAGDSSRVEGAAPSGSGKGSDADGPASFDDDPIVGSSSESADALSDEAGLGASEQDGGSTVGSSSESTDAFSDEAELGFLGQDSGPDQPETIGQDDDSAETGQPHRVTESDGDSAESGDGAAAAAPNPPTASTADDSTTDCGRSGGSEFRGPGPESASVDYTKPPPDGLWETIAQQRADAFVDLFENGSTFTTEVVLHVRGDGNTGDDGTPLTDNAVISTLPGSFIRGLIHDAERRPINASGRQRHPTDRQKRVVHERHRGQCIDCGSTVLVEYDHVPDYNETGHTIVDELQLRCPTCHHARHGRYPTNSSAWTPSTRGTAPTPQPDVEATHPSDPEPGLDQSRS